MIAHCADREMKRFLSIIVILGFVGGCSKKFENDAVPGSSGWLVESYDNGVITVVHEGNTYRATCAMSRSFNNADSVTNPNDVHTFQNCDLAIDLVGQNVQGFEGQNKDAHGCMVIMWSLGS